MFTIVKKYLELITSMADMAGVDDDWFNEDSFTLDSIIKDLASVEFIEEYDKYTQDLYVELANLIKDYKEV